MGRSFLSIDARSSRELQAVLLSMKLASRDVNKVIRFQSKRVIAPEWQKGLDARASTEAEQVILASSGRVAVSDNNVTLRAGGLTRRLSGGLSTSQPTTAGAVEFGANRAYTRSYKSRSRKGKAYEVRKRHTQRQLKSGGKGYVVYPTAENMIPRIASLWIQSVVKVMHDASEGNYRG